MSFFTEPAKEQPSADAAVAEVPRAGFFKSWEYAYKAQVAGAATHGIENEMQKLDREQMLMLKDAGVENMPAFSPNSVGWLTSVIPGPSADSDFYRGVAENMYGERDLETQERMQDYDTRIEELRAKRPDLELRTSVEMFQEVQKRAQEFAIKEAGPKTIRGWVGTLGGGMVGSLNPDSDPLNFTTLGVGGVGKTAAKRIASQAGAQGVIEGLNQITGVQEQRELLGLDYGLKDGIVRTGTAMLGGAAFQSIGEGLAIGARRLFRSKPTDPAPDASILPDSVVLKDDSAVPVRRVAADPEVAATRLARDPSSYIELIHLKSPHGAGKGRERTEIDIKVVRDQLDDFSGPSPVDVQPPRSGEAPVGSVEAARAVDPDAFRRLDTLLVKARDMAEELKELPKRTVSAVRKNSEALIKAERKAAFATGKERTGLKKQIRKLMKQRQDLVNRNTKKLSPEQAAVLRSAVKTEDGMREIEPLIERAYARASGKWDGQDVGSPAGIDQKGGVGSVKDSPNERVGKTKREDLDPVVHETVADKRIQDVLDQQDILTKALDAYRGALGKVTKGDDSKISVTGYERKLDIDKETVNVFDEDGNPKAITLRELLEENYKAEQELEAVSTCSTK